MYRKCKNKRITAALISIMILFSLGGYISNAEKIITNIDEEKNIKNQNNVLKENTGVLIENEEYTEYKGPVQGEIKYKEGTPASENSRDYKALGDIKSPYKVDLVVTSDFGHTKIFAKNVGLVKDEVGMEVLFRNLDIQTAYGGGFVNAINGLESKFTFNTGAERKKKDWFYWVNGILAPIGVAEYKPEADDVIWWDYHSWGMTMFIPAVIGSYPQPFKNGFWGENPGTVIMYTKDMKNAAEKLKESLINKGVKEIDISPYDPTVLEEPEKYYILLGQWKELSKESEFLQITNKKSKLIGIYSKFEDNKLHSLNFKGKKIESYDKKAGAIYATAPGMGRTKPIWLVTGIDKDGVKLALDVLINKPESIKNCFGAVITEEKIENVPYLN
ncbi:DUF4430 domain-containing protein [Maledivibacter halophilus]|uniref:Transcobalamin-like C-terminal domain-containing protein n=1 Tax=Maledivibacter halophilus TaxID=36842 RepID=A0A1T5J2Z6_9FIRM|nr:DUF4430 domain-containing protein [Maledivibacter halophilus]SKC45744.1 protein of unknown function [Maledivibacter halophilus]